MSISQSLSNALSGLHVAGRMAETVSANISNAMTEGYGRRDIEVTQRTIVGHGAGAAVAGVTRRIDPVVLANRRIADAELGQVSVRTEFLEEVERAIGMPDEATSLSGRMGQFEAALIQAASRPDQEARQYAVVEAAKSVATHLGQVSDTIQAQRMQADREIAGAVEFLNDSLNKIAQLTAQILRIDGSVRDASALIDHRQRLVDGIAEWVPIREYPKEHGTIGLITAGGASLLDGTTAVFGFDQAGMIVPEMSIGAGSLSGLTINGQPVSTSLESGAIAGGRLAGLFDVRDGQAVAAQTRLDAVARDLVERFQDPAVDPTLAVGDPGLFTDTGAAFDVVNEVGLSTRLTINAAVDPAAGGALWRVRDGIGATAPGDAGDATLLNALTDALTASRLPASGDFSAPHSATGLTSDLLSGISVQRHSLDLDRAYARSHQETLKDMELKNGVDTDEEMQRLLQVEQAFAANARVISTIDEMIQQLIGI